MGRNLSPLVQEELENLEKDAESRKIAMKALKSYATNIETKAIPQFLAQVSETNSQVSPTAECTISLFEVLARVHGRNIVPQIGSIMTTIIRTLSTSTGSFPLHLACSKVVPAIARYGIDPSTPDDEKKKIISALSTPLSNVLMSSHENLASGSALCLKALVESNNWKYASDDTINNVCLKVAGALEVKTAHTNSHLGLAMALAKHNSSKAEAYVGSLIRSGLNLLSIGSAENNSQKRFTAIQMINFLLKCFDPRSISSELVDVVDALEKCQADHMPYIKGAAFEALQTAKSVASQKGSKGDVSRSPIISLNLHRRNEKSPQAALDKLCKPPTVKFLTPESHTITSSVKHENFTDSPSSVKHITSNNEYLDQRTQRRLWANDFGGVDISLKDNFFLKECPRNDAEKYEGEQVKDGEEHSMSRTQSELTESFNGFLLSNEGSTESRVTTLSPQVLSDDGRTQRRLWANDFGGVDISFKDNFFMKECPKNDAEKYEGEHVKDGEEHSMSRTQSELTESFNGLVLSNEGSTKSRETTPSPQKSPKLLTFNDIHVYTTPRKLMRSLQNQNDDEKQAPSIQGASPVLCKVQCGPTEESVFLDSDISIMNKNRSISDSEQVRRSIESVSSTADPVEDTVHEETSIPAAADFKGSQMEMAWHKKSLLVLVCGLAMLLLASIMSIMRNADDEFSYGLVPT